LRGSAYRGNVLHASRVGPGCAAASTLWFSGKKHRDSGAHGLQQGLRGTLFDISLLRITTIPYRHIQLPQPVMCDHSNSPHTVVPRHGL